MVNRLPFDKWGPPRVESSTDRCIKGLAGLVAHSVHGLLMVRAEVRMTSAEYRDALKGGPVSLSNSQAGQARNFSQPRAHLLVNPCSDNESNMN